MRVALPVLLTALCVLMVAGCSPAAEMINPAVVGNGHIERVRRNLSDFQRISVSDAIVCDVKIGSPASAVVEVPSSLLTLIDTRVEGDQLIVALNRHVTVTGTVKVHVVAPKLDALVVDGAAMASANDVTADSFNLSANGASRVTVNGHLGDASVDAGGASQVKLLGVAGKSRFSASGASSIDSTNLTATHVDANASGASTIDVGTCDELDASASGASTVHYIGNPKVGGSGAEDVASSVSHG